MLAAPMALGSRRAASGGACLALGRKGEGNVSFWQCATRVLVKGGRDVGDLVPIAVGRD